MLSALFNHAIGRQVQKLALFSSAPSGTAVKENVATVQLLRRVPGHSINDVAHPNFKDRYPTYAELTALMRLRKEEKMADAEKSSIFSD